LSKVNKNSSIFNKTINNKYKLVPFNKIENPVGNTKYFPAFSKEWINSVYYYNNNNLKNLPSYDININNLIKNYFSLYFNDKFLKIKKGIPYKFKRLALNKIFLSKAEIKHTSSKAIITIYTYNREKIVLEKNIEILKESFFNKVLFFMKKGNTIYKNISNNVYNIFLKHILNQELILIRRYKLRLDLNKYKFQELFLLKLSNMISKIYQKRVEFNIINLKSIFFNSDILTNILVLKIRRKKVNIMRAMNVILSRTMLPKVNRIIERSRLIKNIDFDLIENKYKNLNINYLLNKSGLDHILNGIYSNNTFEKNYKKLYDIIFNSIKYKNMGGIRFEVKGRLTKRYRADRSVYKVRWKGGLKNIDSSFKGLSSVNLRGYSNPNVEYTIRPSKRRIGSFAVKGWISGK
jgi:hypothetical protein